MNRPYKNQRGSAHVVVMIGLVVALLFALGWIFWRNFIYKEPVKTTTQTVMVKPKAKATTPKTTAPSTKTYTDTATGVSFDYPSDWSVTTANASGSNVVAVADANGTKVAYLEENLNGLGGAGGMNGTVLATTPWSAIGSYVCAFTITNSNGQTELQYGITAESACSTPGSGTFGVDSFVLSSNNNAAGHVSFSNVDYAGGSGTSGDVVSQANATTYVQSSEYQQIKAMLTSLKY